MKFNYTDEINNILNDIYKYKVCEVAYNNLNEINLADLEESKNIIKNTKVYLGNDMHDFIIGLIPADKDGYFFRCEIAKYYNHSYPRMYDHLGNTLKSVTASKFAIQLWENHMNNLLLEDVDSKFSQTDFYGFVENNFDSMIEDINNYISTKSITDKIVIEFKDKSELLNSIKQMIINKKLDFSWAEMLVDIDKLREEMILSSAAFHIYNEYDKLEDELDYCLDKYGKYTSNELFNLLVKEIGFTFDENIGLIK